MSEHTTIEWCDATWSPWEGCTKVSPGCDHCYAEGMNRWLRKGENWGPGAPRRIYSEEHWEKPFKWQRDALKFETLHSRRRRVFPSVCDPFDNEAPPILRDRLFATIRATPALDWLLLTKRIGNAKSMLPADWGSGYANVWLGTTVVNQEEADRDIPKLLQVPARVRFLSMEPLLGPVDLSKWLQLGRCSARGGGPPPLRCGLPAGHDDDHSALIETGAPWFGVTDDLHWVIAGGESGRKARPSNPDWYRSLRDQCEAAGVPFLFKQWGAWGPHDRGARDTSRQPTIPAMHRQVIHWGKKAAGRLLDGAEHNGFPNLVLGASKCKRY